MMRVVDDIPVPKYHGRLNGLGFTVSHLWLEPMDRYNGSRRIYRLVKPFHITMFSAGCQLSILVPTGFETDFASFPLFVQFVLGGHDAVGVSEASICHDYACTNKLPAPVASALMLSVLAILAVPRWKRMLIIFGLTYMGYRSPIQRFFRRFRKGKTS